MGKNGLETEAKLKSKGSMYKEECHDPTTQDPMNVS